LSKTVFRYFFDFMEGQEKWLNNMAQSGYRLVKCGKLKYKFEPCSPGKYEYIIEFIADRSTEKAKDYRQFLEEMEYRTFTRNVKLKVSIGRARRRSWSGGDGESSDSSGSYDIYNNELLIVEKQPDGEPFEPHTSIQEVSTAFITIRNSFLTSALLTGFLGIAGLTSIINLSIWASVAFCIVCAIFVFPAVKHTLLALKYTQMSKAIE